MVSLSVHSRWIGALDAIAVGATSLGRADREFHA
jgi:hypothetical protein